MFGLASLNCATTRDSAYLLLWMVVVVVLLVVLVACGAAVAARGKGRPSKQSPKWHCHPHTLLAGEKPQNKRQ